MRANCLWLLLTVWGVLATAVDLTFAQTWTQTSAPVTNWTAVASSADGIKLAAAADSGGIWHSTNSGGTWTQTSAPRVSWASIATSADGSQLAAGASYSTGSGATGLFYTSTDSGNTWLAGNLPNLGWASIACSADGSKLAALSGPALFGKDATYSSTDSGTHWVSNNTTIMSSVASSADGTKLVEVGFGNLFSTNTGITWTRANSLTGQGLSVASAANGTYLVVAAEPWICISTNSGMTWTQTTAPATNWIAVASSANGSRLVAVVGGSRSLQNPVFIGPIYSSTNSGMTWTSNAVPVQHWSSVASSADGGKVVAVVHGGGIWTSQTTSSPQLNLVPSPTNLALTWTIPSTNFVLQESADLASWANRTDTPVLNLTNLQNQVTLWPSNSSGFYRLKTP